jgi:hypothetical protein
MTVSFSCPLCHESATCEIGPGLAALTCPHCKQEILIPEGAIQENQLRRCLVCPSADLYVRKDFPQQLGVAIVTVGLLASCVSWGFHMTYLTFGILFATALIDVVLYLFVGDALMCYRCNAVYRGFEAEDQHGAFDLEIHERHRQIQARLKQQPGAQSLEADAPELEERHLAAKPGGEAPSEPNGSPSH